MKRKVLIVFFLISGLALCLQAQQNPPKVTLTPVGGPVYMLQGGGGNIGVVADPAGIFMIDAMEQPVAGQIREAIKSLPGGGRVQVLVNTHWPYDHTDGNTVVFLDALKVVHMGDLFFNGMFPFLDVAHGGDIENWVRQLDIILGALPSDSKIIPGHGPLAGVAELRAFRRMLSDSADIVRKQMKEGKTLEQIKAAGVPDSLAPWTKGFLTTPEWLEMVYRSLEKRGRS